MRSHLFLFLWLKWMLCIRRLFFHNLTGSSTVVFLNLRIWAGIKFQDWEVKDIKVVKELTWNMKDEHESGQEENPLPCSHVGLCCHSFSISFFASSAKEFKVTDLDTKSCQPNAQNIKTRWWFQAFFTFTLSWGDDPVWQAYFCTWVEITNYVPPGSPRRVCEVPPLVPDMYGGYMPMPGGSFGRFWRMESTIEKENTKKWMIAGSLFWLYSNSRWWIIVIYAYLC